MTSFRSLGNRINSQWSCRICPYFTGRKWNLERHYEKVHGQIMNTQFEDIQQNPRIVNKQRNDDNNVSDTPRSDSWVWREKINELAKIQNSFANSKQTLDRLNFFETKSKTLENQLHETYQHNWVIPRFHVQGLNGYLCKICNSFSFRLVMDLGYDLTMKLKHNCLKQIGAFTVPVPKDTHDVDRWAASILFDQMSYSESIGNRLVLDDITKLFDVYKDNEYRDLILGIPDRHPMITLEDDVVTDLIEITLKSPGQRKLLLDNQILDLLTKTKSTYGILKVPDQEDYKYLFMRIVK